MKTVFGIDTGYEIDDAIYNDNGFYCMECKSFARPYKQGLTCSCNRPWRTETINEKVYPERWVMVNVQSRYIESNISTYPAKR